jgi:hypothetical protein
MPKLISALVPSKKSVYVALTMVLFVLLAFIAYCFLAAAFSDFFFTQSDEFCESCRGEMLLVMPLPLLALSFMGAIIGHHVGGKWWHFIYVADKRGRNHKIDW